MMQKFWIFWAVVSIPCFLGLSAWQSVRFETLHSHTQELDLSQRELLAENKHLIADLSALSSINRIETLALTELGLKRIESEALIQVKLGGAGD